ncbi:hypothetical protein B9Z65_9025 [Elsinoe australis]|uniref:Uncharacterized protein n=1 Tax=Elsinoe australis TaxID=40998 RepID=A0A2P8ABK9_9PEZI|nr:hypothetical protein B9Z65_9025 [Elsinoe australis]
MITVQPFSLSASCDLDEDHVPQPQSLGLRKLLSEVEDQAAFEVAVRNLPRYDQYREHDDRLKELEARMKGHKDLTLQERRELKAEMGHAQYLLNQEIEILDTNRMATEGRAKAVMARREREMQADISLMVVTEQLA